MPDTKSTKPTRLNTLAVDIGGTGMKIMVLDPDAKPLTERLRLPTPDPATPRAMLDVLQQLVSQIPAGTPAFDRVSIGYPGVIKAGKTWTAANLDDKWIGFPLQETIEQMWKKPTRVANDAAVQGYGAISGKDVELVITLGTGMGSALYTDGYLCPGLELGHHPWRKGKTYEEYLGRAGLKEHGPERWNELVEKAIDQTSRTFNWDRLYIGGGNAKKLTVKFTDTVQIISNEDGLLGGVALWRDPR